MDCGMHGRLGLGHSVCMPALALLTQFVNCSICMHGTGVAGSKKRRAGANDSGGCAHAWQAYCLFTAVQGKARQAAREQGQPCDESPEFEADARNSGSSG